MKQPSLSVLETQQSCNAKKPCSLVPPPLYHWRRRRISRQRTSTRARCTAPTSRPKSDNETKPVTWTCQANQRHQGWNSVWVSIENPGNHIDVSVGGIPLPSITITTIPALLPQPDIVNTRWFHCDSLAHVARVPVWSEAHWKMIENHMIAARRMHINCLLMPLWTPPLDTAPGQQRLPTQLLEITRDDNGQYSFDGTRAIRWLNLLKNTVLAPSKSPYIHPVGSQSLRPVLYSTRRRRSSRLRLGHPSYRSGIPRIPRTAHSVRAPVPW